MKDINEVILEELRAHRTETKDGFAKINGRVRSLEETRAEQRGAMKTVAGFSAVISAGITYLIDYVRHP